MTAIPTMTGPDKKFVVSVFVHVVSIVGYFKVRKYDTTSLICRDDNFPAKAVI